MVNPDEKRIVLARLMAMPEDMSASIGGYGKISKHELIEHVEKEDEIGALIVNVYMDGLRALKGVVASA